MACLSNTHLANGEAPFGFLPDFGQSLARLFPAHPESQVHPHVEAECASHFQAFTGEAMELEALTLLNALVRLYKPATALETGTGRGYATIAIAAALAANGGGLLHSVDSDAGAVQAAGQNIDHVHACLRNHVALHHADSRQFIDAYTGGPFDLILFDSLISFRHLEYEKLRASNLLAPGAICLFHDTSRCRGETMDSNADMVAALDEISEGNQWIEWPFSRGMRLLRVLETGARFGKSGRADRLSAERRQVPQTGREIAEVGR